jgi:peptidoglycan/xylan/chitin deacetylase (PgdA/CDA1 family)
MSYRFLQGLALSLSLSLCCKPKEEIAASSSPDVVILCFHDVGRVGRYAITFDTFSGILDDLKPYEVISAGDWLREGQARSTKKQVVLTFDDGYTSHREVVLPELSKRGYGATFFFYNEQLLNDKKWRVALKQLPAAFDIGSHSWSHSSLSESPSAELFRELYLAREHIAELAGNPTHLFAWPYGSWSEPSAEAARAAGFKYLFSVDYRLARAADIPKIIPRYTVMGSRSREQVRSILAEFERRTPGR